MMSLLGILPLNYFIRFTHAVSFTYSKFQYNFIGNIDFELVIIYHPTLFVYAEYMQRC